MRHLIVMLAAMMLCTACEQYRPSDDNDAPDSAAAGTPPQAATPEQAQLAEQASARTDSAAPGATSGKDSLVPFRWPGKATTTDYARGCGFEGLTLPENAKIYAAGAYSGRRLDYQIDQSGHQATRIDVAVNHPDAPVALMLGAYEPTVWNIGWSRSTRILAVLVGGYHHQAVAGLPADVPVLVSNHHNKGPCGYFYVAPDQVGRLNPIALTAWGRKVDMVYPADNGTVAIGQPVADTGSLVTSSRVSPESFRDPDAPLAGETGLRDAVAKGLLREARLEDVEAWATARAQATASGDRPPIAGQAPMRAASGVPYNSYVVLKPMQVPAGLYGAHAVTFFVPKGVPRPSGNLGHSRIHDFNTLTCAGLTCFGE